LEDEMEALVVIGKDGQPMNGDSEEPAAPSGSTADAYKLIDIAFKKDEHELEKQIKVAKDVAELYDMITKMEAPLIEGLLSPPAECKRIDEL
jgi:hypothetical protein